jgi:hypothetical protein
MSHHDRYIHKTLRLCNKPSDLLETSSNGFFSARVPAELRDKPAYVHVQNGLVTNLNNIFPAGVDVNVIFVRSNLSTNSYDVTTKGDNRFLGSLVRPANSEKAEHLDSGTTTDLGRVILPPVIEIEILGSGTFDGALTRLDQADSIIEIILGLEFEDESK